MNILFAVIFTASTAALLFFEPTALLPALLNGAEKSAVLALSLLTSYAVWLGVMRLWEDSGVTRGVSRLLRPVCKRLFKTEDEKTLGAIGMNLAANMLGIGGAATPYGIKAANLLDKSPCPEYASAMLFVLNATSLQLVPTSIITLRVAVGSSAATDIILPTFLTTLFSTLLGVALTMLFIRPDKREKRAEKTARIRLGRLKKHGAGAR